MEYYEQAENINRRLGRDAAHLFSINTSSNLRAPLTSRINHASGLVYQPSFAPENLRSSLNVSSHSNIGARQSRRQARNSIEGRAILSPVRSSHVKLTTFLSIPSYTNQPSTYELARVTREAYK